MIDSFEIVGKTLEPPILSRRKHIQTPVDFQRRILGINGEYAKKTGMDIGCGDGNLVRALNNEGALFEGIDPNSRDEQYFVRQRIRGMHPMSGAIPRGDNCYDVVVAFQNGTLNEAFIPTEMECHDSEMNSSYQFDCLFEGQLIIYEGLRVLKPDGRFVVYPGLVQIEDLMGSMLRQEGFDFKHESLIPKDVHAYLDDRTKGNGVHLERCEKYGYNIRTVLTKKN